MDTRRVLPIAAVLLLLAACSGGSAPHSPHPTVRPSASPSTSGPRIDIGSLEGQIVLSDETNDIWSMRADGTHVRRLTSSPAMEFDPTWSPDGSRIAYRHWPHNGTSRIFVMKADGSDQWNLTRKDVWGPDWSPDGRRIAFNSVVGTGGFDVYGYVVAPDGSGLRRISRHYVEYPAWSPDGSRIAFMAPEPGATGSNPDYNIFGMDADGSHVRRLTTAPGEDGWPAWSPDGTRIVFSSARLPNHRGHWAVGRRLDHQRGRHGPAARHFGVRAVLRLVAGRLGHPRCGRRGDVSDPPRRLRPNALPGRGRREPSFPRLDRMRSSRVLGARSPRYQRLLCSESCVAKPDDVPEAALGVGFGRRRSRVFVRCYVCPDAFPQVMRSGGGRESNPPADSRRLTGFEVRGRSCCQPSSKGTRG